ncbi:MAG: DUF3501 family protein [Pseudomonadales bacterium]|nr:DUF3501 family protein [Pseudomonadales bacterium]
MPKLNRQDLWSLEDYSNERAAFRERVLAHKKDRKVLIGDHILFIFEDLLSIRYQVQEMLRIEKVFDAAGITDELEAYNPLIPDGNNWKCTMLIQYADVDERKIKLQEMKGIEDCVWVKVDGQDPVFAIADEDMERANDEKTSAVHFLRFQFPQEMVASLQSGAAVQVGIDHQAYEEKPLQLPEPTRASLVSDLSGA